MNTAAKEKIQFQIRMTWQFLIVVVTTVVCSMTPSILSNILIALNASETYAKIAPFIWTLQCLNSGINFIIYMAMNPELRKAFLTGVPCYSSATVQPSTGGAAT